MGSSPVTLINVSLGSKIWEVGLLLILYLTELTQHLQLGDNNNSGLLDNRYDLKDAISFVVNPSYLSGHIDRQHY